MTTYLSSGGVQGPIKFTKTKNIETAFQHIRLFSMVFLLSCAGLTGFIV